MADDRKLDALLNEALASYASQEPDAGLNARISAKVADAAPRPQRTWLSCHTRLSWHNGVSWRAGVFAAATACAAVVLLTLLYHPAHLQTPQPHTTAAIADSAKPLAIVNAAPPQSVPAHAALAIHRKRRDRQPALLRAASFPTPTPLTPEESLLLKFATEHPEQARQLLTSTSRDNAPLDTKPLSITPIHIAALADAESQQSHD